MTSKSKRVFAPVQGEGRGGVKSFMEQKQLIQISDMNAIEGIVDGVLSQNQQQLQQYCAGKTKLQGFFVGQALFLAPICLQSSATCEEVHLAIFAAWKYHLINPMHHPRGIHKTLGLPCCTWCLMGFHSFIDCVSSCRIAVYVLPHNDKFLHLQASNESLKGLGESQASQSGAQQEAQRGIRSCHSLMRSATLSQPWSSANLSFLSAHQFDVYFSSCCMLVEAWMFSLVYFPGKSKKPGNRSRVFSEYL